MLAGGKLHEHRKRQKWNDKNYNKANGILDGKLPLKWLLMHQVLFLKE